jgi:2-polyprenyl-6-methoxyphenol hydroxylase-like FAD-dependent oxidoreductase
MFCAIALARRGHDVICVDRDPGPTGDTWNRVGVMQFEHPHFFRHFLRVGLCAEMPETWDAILAAGGVPALIAGLPEEMTGLASRRSTVERVIRQAAMSEPGLALHIGHADEVLVHAGAATGVRVDGVAIDADLVISAAGRASHFGDELRGPTEGGPTGFSYVSRMYRAKPGAEPMASPTPEGEGYDGYFAIAFPQDDNTLSALIVRPTADKELAAIRDTTSFDAAVAAIPVLAQWTDPDRFEPISAVMPGGGLSNTYCNQGPEPGTPPARGLFFVGDAVCTTNPQAGRGIGLGIKGAQHLLAIIDDASLSGDDASDALDAWTDAHIKPWWADHVYWDATLLDRFAGNDIDVDAPISSDVICHATDADPSLMSVVGPFMGMMVDPTALKAVEERVRDLLRTGWRPSWGSGPTRDELVSMLPRSA